MNIKQKILELCDTMITFWQQLGKEIEGIPDKDNAKLVYTWHEYFEQHKEVIEKLSETKWDVEDVEIRLIMKKE